MLSLDKKEISLAPQFFTESGVRESSDFIWSLEHGHSFQYATNVGVLSIYSSLSIGLVSGSYEGHARVCSSSTKAAISAVLLCDTTSGALMRDLKVILRKQKGD